MSVLLLALFLQTADLVLHGGKVITFDPSGRIAEIRADLVVLDGKIAYERTSK
jgi:hypothetical protein